MLSIETVATVYGVFMSLAPLLQARKMWRRRSSEDISILYLVVLLVGFSLYLTYGASIANRLLIITNSVSIAATATTLFIAATLKSRATDTTQQLKPNDLTDVGDPSSHAGTPPDAGRPLLKRVVATAQAQAAFPASPPHFDSSQAPDNATRKLQTPML